MYLYQGTAKKNPKQLKKPKQTQQKTNQRKKLNSNKKSKQTNKQKKFGERYWQKNLFHYVFQNASSPLKECVGLVWKSLHIDYPDK